MITAALGRAAITGAVVFLVLWLLRRGGLRMSGLFAAVPVMSGPALLWMCLDHGPAFAAPGCTAALLATVLAAVFVLGYARAATRCGPAPALLLAAAAAALAALATAPLSGLPATLLLAAAVLPVARALLGDVVLEARPPAPLQWPRDAALTVLASASVSGLLAVAGPWLGPWASGLLAALPIVGTTSAVLLHRRHGAAAVRQFLGGYLDGLGTNAVFLATLALLLPTLPTGAAWALAVGAALARQQLARWSRHLRASPTGPWPPSAASRP